MSGHKNNALAAWVPTFLALPYVLSDGGGKIFFFDSLNSLAPLDQFYTSWAKLHSG